MPYTYKLVWNLDSHNIYYYGCRVSNKADKTDIMKTYFTSSKYVKEFIKENGLPDKVSTREFETKEDALNWERAVLCRVNASHNALMLNRSNGIGEWHNFKDGFKDKATQLKAHKTLVEKYGSRGSASDEIKSKIELTNKERYGTIHTLNLPNVKLAREKANLEKYGHVNPFASKKYYEDRINPMHDEKHRLSHLNAMKKVDWESRDVKIKESNLEKYGVEHYYQSDTFKEKVKQSNIEKYGVSHFSQTQEYKDRMNKKRIACPYGCRNGHLFDVGNFSIHMKSKAHGWTNEQISEYKGKLNENQTN